MDDIYYLIHTTNNPDCVNWTEIRTAEFNTDDQFPGAYLTIISKHNIDTERVYTGKYIIILSKTLLLQKNYHINARDYNGIVSEKNTYFSWNLATFLQSQSNPKYGKMHEVVFHDSIDMKYCAGIVGVLQNPLYTHINAFLPRRVLTTTDPPDMSKLPFVCYPFESIYTGSNPMPLSSLGWFKHMAKVCNVPISLGDTENDIMEKIKDVAHERYTHRESQNIELLKTYTYKKGFKRHTFRKRYNKGHK